MKLTKISNVFFLAMKVTMKRIRMRRVARVVMRVMKTNSLPMEVRCASLLESDH